MPRRSKKEIKHAVSGVCRAQLVWSSEGEDEDDIHRRRAQSNAEYGGHCRRPRSGFDTQVDSSDSHAPVVRSGRFAHVPPKTRLSWQSRSDLIEEVRTTGEPQFNLGVHPTGSRGCAVPAIREFRRRPPFRPTRRTWRMSSSSI